MIKVPYDPVTGDVDLAYDYDIDCPSPYILVTENDWASIQHLKKKVINDQLVVVSSLGPYTKGYIAKLNTLYPTLGLTDMDTVETAGPKLMAAGVTYEEVDTLLNWYERGM